MKSDGEVDAHWGDYETQKNCTTHFSAPLHIAFSEEARPLLSNVDVRCLLLHEAAYMGLSTSCVYVCVFMVLVCGCSEKRAAVGSLTPSSLKLLCGRRVFFWPFNVSFVLPTRGGAPTNGLPVMVNGEVVLREAGRGI